MQRRTVLPLLALVAALSFGLGWLLRPGFHVAGFPEAGALEPVSGKCRRTGAPLQELRALSEDAVRYAPGDSAAAEAVSFQRRGTSATLLVIRGGMLDDEVDAQATQYDLQWTPASGWVVTDCRSAIRFQPGRP
ncbi:MAG: hypothetical protein QM820_01235 [Minicystis sp.]